MTLVPGSLLAKVQRTPEGFKLVEGEQQHVFEVEGWPDTIISTPQVTLRTHLKVLE
jgi:hypothetical protein